MRYCSECGSPNHNRAVHFPRKVRRRNLDAFVDHGGVIHPIRNSPGYDEGYVRSEHEYRRESGQSSRETQSGRAFTRHLERETRRAREADRAARLTDERDALKEKIRDDPASSYTDLIGVHGRARSESGLIPIELARQVLPKRPESYRTSLVKRGGHTYLRREYVLDELGENLGFRGSTEFERALERSRREKAQLAALNREITAAKRKETTRSRRRNPPAVRRLFLFVGKWRRREAR